MSLQDADPRFFNAALELFGFGRKNIQLIATEYADSQADQSTTDIEEAFDDSDSYPETSDSSQETASVSKSADVDTRFLGTIAKDIVNAGHPLPAWLEPYLNNDSDGLLEAGNGSSPFYDTRQRPPLLQWTSQARNIKNNPFIPFFQDRGLSRDRWKSLSRSQNP